MATESPFYSLSPRREVEAEVSGAKEEPLEGTNGQTKIPIAGPLSVKVCVEGNIKRWPAFFADDFIGRFHFYAKPLAEEITNAGLTGIEFHPVQLSFGNLRKLAGKEAECPEYVWARVTGIVFLDYYLQGKPVETNENGMCLLKRDKSLLRADRIIRDEQPRMLDFNRPVPGNSHSIVISPRVAEFLGSRLDKEEECAMIWLDLKRTL